MISLPLARLLSWQLLNGIESVHRRSSVQRRSQLTHTDPTWIRIGNKNNLKIQKNKQQHQIFKIIK